MMKPVFFLPHFRFLCHLLKKRLSFSFHRQRKKTHDTPDLTDNEGELGFNTFKPIFYVNEGAHTSDDAESEKEK